MNGPKRFKLRNNRLFTDKKIGLQKVLSSIMELMEKQYSKDRLQMHLHIEGPLPKTVDIEEKYLCYLFFYVIEAYIFDIGRLSALKVIVSQQEMGDYSYLYFVLTEEAKHKQSPVFFKLWQAVERVVRNTPKDSFSFELATDLIQQLDGRIWIEYHDQHPPQVHFMLKC